jgi:hypothetical protein
MLQRSSYSATLGTSELPFDMLLQCFQTKGHDLVAVDVVRRYERRFIFVVGMQGYLVIP